MTNIFYSNNEEISRFLYCGAVKNSNYVRKK